MSAAAAPRAVDPRLRAGRVSAWANWRLVLPELAKHSRAIAPDMVGFGFTERPANATYDMDYLGRPGDRSARRAGHRADRPGRQLLRRRVGAGAGDPPSAAGAPAGADGQRRRAVCDHAGAGRGLGLHAFAGRTCAACSTCLPTTAAWSPMNWRNCATRPASGPASRNRSRRCSRAPRQRWVDAMASAEADIRACRHETLVVHGRDDQVIPLANSLTLAQWIDRSQLHVFGRCGHWTQIEHAARFARLVDRFPCRSRTEWTRP